MGEIKSTLDLVMERTRHLSLSDEERARQKKEAFDKRLQGLLQQVADGALTVAAVTDRIAALRAELQVGGPQAVVAGIVGRIDPDRDNRAWLEMLAQMDPSAGEPLEATLADYHTKRRALLQDGEKRLRERLARDHGIPGSAVIPNPRNEPACRQGLAELKQQALTDLQGRSPAVSSSDQT